MAVAVPVGMLVWPQQIEEPRALEQIGSLGQLQREERREALASRGGKRTPPPHPSTSPTVALSTPAPTETRTPTETSTPEPTPTPTETPTPEPTVSAEMYATTALNVRTGPGTGYEVVTVLDPGAEVGVTGTTDGSWVQIIHDDEVAWVSGDYLSQTEPPPEVTGQMYVTTALNARTGPGTGYEVVTVLDPGAEVGVTGTTDGSWVQIIHDDEVAWVSGDYLSETEPAPEVSYAECPDGSAIESSLTPDAVRVYRALCAAFPELTTYHGWRDDTGAHGEGRAVDFMISSSSQGDAIAAWVQDHYAELGVSQIIWSQRIWTVARSDEGWRLMEDRGSVTANHYDHVHVTVYGYATD